MKTKVLLTLALTLLMSVSVYAQETAENVENTQKPEQTFKRHDVSLSYGRGTTVGISLAGYFLTQHLFSNFDKTFTNALDTIFGTSATSEIEQSIPKLVDYNAIGSISFDYSYHFTKIIAADAGLSYSLGKMIYGVKGENNEYSNVGYTNLSCFTAMLGVKFNWVRRPHFGLYSRLMVGATYLYYNSHDTNSNDDIYFDDITSHDIAFNGQISPIGLEGGNESFRGFLELGLGQNGMFQAGIRYKFD